MAAQRKKLQESVKSAIPWMRINIIIKVIIIYIIYIVFFLEIFPYFANHLNIDVIRKIRKGGAVKVLKLNCYIIHRLCIYIY